MQSPGRIASHYNKEVASTWDGTKSFTKGFAERNKVKKKAKETGLVHVNKRQAAYKKKTGITRAVMAK